MATTTTRPTKTLGQQMNVSGTKAVPLNLYGDSLSRYTESKKDALAKMEQAESGYGELSQIYAPGGSYGAGQYATINREMARGVSTAQAGAIGSGMSSSTNAAGMGARFVREGTQAKLGVEDVRADKYASVLQGLASLRMSAAGQMGTMAANEPSYAPAAQTYGNIYGTDVAAASNKYSTDITSSTQKYLGHLGYKGAMDTANLASQTQQNIARMEIQSRNQIAGQKNLGSSVAAGSGAPW